MSQGRREKFTRTLRKCSRKRSVIWGISGFWVCFGASNFSCEPHGERKETHLCPSTDRVRFRLFPSTVWAGRKYGLDWFRVRFRYPFRRERVREPHAKTVPSAQKLLPTGIFILGNYLEIGNALPYRKNCFQEIFGPVIVIKSVMENLAGKVLFFVCPRDKLSGIIPVKTRSSELNR